MLASSAVDMQLGVDGHKPSDCVPYMSCTPSCQSTILNRVQLRSKRRQTGSRGFSAGTYSRLCDQCRFSPNLGRGAAPKVNKAPRTPTLTLRSTTSLQYHERQAPRLRVQSSTQLDLPAVTGDNLQSRGPACPAVDRPAHKACACVQCRHHGFAVGQHVCKWFMFSLSLMGCMP